METDRLVRSEKQRSREYVFKECSWKNCKKSKELKLFNKVKLFSIAPFSAFFSGFIVKEEDIGQLM